MNQDPASDEASGTKWNIPWSIGMKKSRVTGQAHLEKVLQRAHVETLEEHSQPWHEMMIHILKVFRLP